MGEDKTLRNDVARCLAQHEEDHQAVFGMFDVRCKCGWKPAADDFVSRKQLLRTHQTDAMIAVLTGSRAEPGTGASDR